MTHDNVARKVRLTVRKVRPTARKVRPVIHNKESTTAEEESATQAPDKEGTIGGEEAATATILTGKYNSSSVGRRRCDQRGGGYEKSTM